jgi:hypothetical protein
VGLSPRHVAREDDRVERVGDAERVEFDGLPPLGTVGDEADRRVVAGGGERGLGTGAKRDRRVASARTSTPSRSCLAATRSKPSAR